MVDELTKPLGLEPKRKTRWIPVVAIALPPLAIATAATIYWFGGFAVPPQPIAVASVDTTEQTAGIPPAKPAPDPAPADPAAPGLTEIPADGSVEDVGGEVVIFDPSKPRPLVLAAAPREDLIERGPYGPLPRVGDDGARPLDVYARPPGKPTGLKPVAIVIGGIGLERAATGNAIKDLPGAVTLAFAPYGDDLAGDLADARSAGHEVLLQVPLEPYNYPSIDPGPKTLTTDARAAENLDRLAWLLSRLTTYVGVMNYMGARFSGDDAALKPVLAEVARRGLLYLDDGSTGRHDLANLAEGPALRADIVLDADTSSAAINAKLDELAGIAAEQGFAIATGTAFPATVAGVAAFARRAAERGVVIVPVSALVPPSRT